MDFIVEIKNKQASFERKVPIFAPSQERAEAWGKRQADVLELDSLKTRIVATQVVAPLPEPPKPEPEPEHKNKSSTRTLQQQGRKLRSRGKKKASLPDLKFAKDAEVHLPEHGIILKKN